MNVHSTISLYRHTGGERQIARRKSCNRPSHILGSSPTIDGREAFREQLVEAFLGDSGHGCVDQAGPDLVHCDAVSHSRDPVRQTWIHIHLPVPFCLRVNEWELLTQERMGSCFLGGTLLICNKKL
jgi:hypothetical protein